MIGDRIINILSSEKFERVADKVCWWGVGLGGLYFIVRILVSVLFDI